MPKKLKGDFKMKAKVMVLATGGTIAGGGESQISGAYTSAVMGVDRMLEALPPLHHVVDIEGEQIANVGSQDMDSGIWFKLGERIETLAQQEAIKGFVITHGTDSMEESAYFLHLTLKTPKPVVLVGAMRNGSSMSADGPLNLYNAVAVALNKESVGKGVLVVMDDEIHCAREVVKTHTSSVHAFCSPNCGKIGSVYYGKVHFYMQSLRKHTLQSDLGLEKIQELPKVVVIYTHVDCKVSLLENSIINGAKGIVVAGMGNGNPGSAFLNAMGKAVKEGVVVVRASRTGGGLVSSTEVDDAKYGFITPDNLNPQKARVLLQLALLKTKDVAKIQEFFNTHWSHMRGDWVPSWGTSFKLPTLYLSLYEPLRAIKTLCWFCHFLLKSVL